MIGSDERNPVIFWYLFLVWIIDKIIVGKLAGFKIPPRWVWPSQLAMNSGPSCQQGLKISLKPMTWSDFDW
jgi:hypothetical protein